MNSFKARDLLKRIDDKILFRVNLSIVELGDKFINEFDFIKIFKRISYKDPDIIQIQLSPSDLKFYQEQRKKFLSKVWISNDEKKWRKAKIIMNGKKRFDIKPGLKVKIVLKQDQRSGKLTEGVVKDILTNSPTHPHGIKVRTTTGDVGRVQEII